MDYITCETLIDGTGTSPQHGKAVIVEQGRVTEVVDQATTPPPAGARVINLDGMTVMPGMIDCHEHLCLDVGDEAAQCAQPYARLVIISTHNAKAILESGITTIRDCGEKDFLDVEIKKAIDEGMIPGPRLVISGQPIIRTGGHAHFLGRETDGVDDMRKAVREQVKRGVDFIKIMVSGGMSTLGSVPDGQEFSDEEIRACMDEAHRAGLPVCAHIHGGPGLKVAVDAGVDTVEHGALLKEEDVEYLAKHDVWLVSTDGVGQVAAQLPDAPEHYKRKSKAGQKHRLKVRQWAKSHGVKVAVGTDTNHARMDMEMQALIDAGWTPMEALQALTLRGAELLGMEADLGTVESGKYADLIALESNPLENPTALNSVQFVMKNGTIYRHDA